MDQRQRRSRLLWLAAVNVTLAAAPVLIKILPIVVGKPMYFGLSWVFTTLYGLPNAPWMLLTVWLSLGTSRFSNRAWGGAAACLYLATIALVQHWLSMQLAKSYWKQDLNLPEPLQFYFLILVQSVALICVISAAWTLPLMVYRARGWELGRLEENPLDHPRRPQLTLFSLFLLTLIVALYLGLGRLAQAPSNPTGIDLRGVGQQGLFTLTFGVIVFVGLWGALKPGRCRWRIVGALILSVLPLGVAYSYCVSLGWKDWSGLYNLPQHILWAIKFVGAPSAVFFGSLLVVRSCGYRLIRRVDTTSSERA